MIAFPSFRGCLGSVAAAAWSPSSLSPVVWLDASDTGTLFDATSGGSLPVDGGTTARWVDKSTNSYAFIQSSTTSGIRPTRRVGASSTGKDVLRFYESNAACALTIGSNSIGASVGGITILMAAKFSVVPTSLNVLFYTVNATNTRLNLNGGRTSDKLDIGGRRVSSDSPYTSIPSLTSLTTAWGTYGGILDFTNSDLYIHVNSATYDNYTPTFGTSGTSDGTAGSAGIGSSGTSSNYIDIGEIIVVNRVLNSTEMNDAVTYLNNKW